MQMNLGIQAGGWDRERVMQKWPPVGMSNEEYAQRWRESQPQFIQGSCVFCERWGHGTGKCWYLVPELQPERWKPEAGIWVFGPGMSYPG
ncbi:hypothetical protein N7508_008115 [Penicillium antarcticum]|uniref:uncharacterized protein n=1 Tax=Penicillium antarcticum TaxID=416450 RepID=UPI0023A0B554|nr:uncharacterized protein N7508_008115 [Penicillium antarcticum]KAJ5297866.1 hypothetical protein N7508_008115 [Penicillium antarcticum]